MDLTKRSFWIVLFRGFTAGLYYGIVVPLVFAVLFVPLWALGLPIFYYLGEFVPALGALVGAAIIARWYARKAGIP